jgi:hypothetical protein
LREDGGRSSRRYRGVAVGGTSPHETEKDKRVNEMREWLIKVGFEPLREEREAYARKFIALGLYSVKMIVNVCTEDVIAGFDWINSTRSTSAGLLLHLIKTSGEYDGPRRRTSISSLTKAVF